MLDKFPVGKERLAVGELSPGKTLKIDIKFDDIDLVEQLRVKFWGSNNQFFTRDINVAESIDLAIYGDELDAARVISANLYTIHAVLADDEERLLMKGRLFMNDTN